MPRLSPRVVCLKQFLRHTFNIKFFMFISVFCCSFLIWFQYPISFDTTNYLVDEALQNVSCDPRYAEINRKKSHLPTDLKYILLWTPADFEPFATLQKGQRAFIANNCSMMNCYVTDNKHFFDSDLAMFDAVAFNGRNLHNLSKKDLPQTRLPHQKYIFFNMESANNYPICQDFFDNFFNWTATYRLDSDILYTYMFVKNAMGKVIGPKIDMEWIEQNNEIDNNYTQIVQNKSKAAAWFVSHCKSKSHREKFASNLYLALKEFDLKMDIYGECGDLKCPQSEKSNCDSLLEKDYFFYMSLENSLAEDYVTEKLLTALQHDVVPIVYGGANYSRFLPPGSYVDGLGFSIQELAALMHRIMQRPKLYQDFFKWKQYYSYHDAERFRICNLCEALNKKTEYETYSNYENFRRWWCPAYTAHCSISFSAAKFLVPLTFAITLYLIFKLREYLR